MQFFNDKIELSANRKIHLDALFDLVLYKTF